MKSSDIEEMELSLLGRFLRGYRTLLLVDAGDNLHRFWLLLNPAGQLNLLMNGLFRQLLQLRFSQMRAARVWRMHVMHNIMPPQLPWNHFPVQQYVPFANPPMAGHLQHLWHMSRTPGIRARCSLYFIRKWAQACQCLVMWNQQGISTLDRERYR